VRAKDEGKIHFEIDAAVSLKSSLKSSAAFTFIDRQKKPAQMADIKRDFMNGSFGKFLLHNIA
jgi:hypothetical protein